MKIPNLFLAVTLLAGFLSSASQAQLGTPRYKLQSRAQLRSLLLQNGRNPHALYDLTILANRAGWLGTVLKTGDEMLQKNRNDPYAQALVAFGVNSGLYARNWSWPVDKSAGNVWDRQASASFFQERSLRVQDPAIQLMAAISKANLPTDREFEESLRLFRLVLKKEPGWADAHYWYGRAVNRANTQKGKTQRQKAAAEALIHNEKAGKLDDGLSDFILFNRYVLLSKLNHPREALAAYNGYLRAYPAFERYMEKEDPGNAARTRARLMKRMNEIK